MFETSPKGHGIKKVLGNTGTYRVLYGVQSSHQKNIKDISAKKNK